MEKNIFPENIPKEILPSNNFISEEDRNDLVKNSNVVKFSRKDVIFKQGTRTSHVMFIKTGMIKIYKEGRGQKTIILKLGTAGHFLGLISIFGEDTFNYSASAIEDSEILFIDINTFKDVLNRNGQYASYLLNVLSIDNLYIFERIMSQSQKQLPGRIADIILYFSEQIYKNEEFEFPLTRNELAELAGTTKESLIRTLTEFKNDKIIELDNKWVRIKSLHIVKTLSRIG